MLVRLGGDNKNAPVCIAGGPPLRSLPASRAANDSGRVLGFSETGRIAAADFDALRAEVMQPYVKQGLVLRSPESFVDLASLLVK